MSKGLVLVSGATGFVGTEVTRSYVDAGYAVRGTARSQEKIKEWEEFNPEYKDKVEWAIVEDIAAPGAFDQAVKGVKYIAHTASPFHYHAEDNERDILQPAIRGTKNMLDAAKSEPNVEHMVITSSFVAIADTDKFPHVGHIYTRNDWNPATYDQAAKSDQPYYVYAASKKLAERTAWEYKERKFAITTINPPLIYGPPHHAFKNMDQINTSSSAIWQLISGNEKDEIPATGIDAAAAAVDVRDVAALHVRAFEEPSAKENRFLCIAFEIQNSQTVPILRKAFAHDAAKLTRIKNGGGDPVTERFGFDSHEAEELLGRPFIGPEQSVVETAARLWEIEAKLKLKA